MKVASTYSALRLAPYKYLDPHSFGAASRTGSPWAFLPELAALWPFCQFHPCNQSIACFEESGDLHATAIVQYVNYIRSLVHS